MTQPRQAKHKRVYDHLNEQISNGILKAGDRLPTEMDLAEHFKTSRPTAARALNLLEAQGMISRRPGAGSFVSHESVEIDETALTFGLLIHGLGYTEIFEPICAAISQAAEKMGNHLRWSTSGVSESDSEGNKLLDSCRRLIRDGVRGVFFAPVEFDEHLKELNHKIIKELADAEITVVLLDRDYLPYPGRSELDLVGLNNYRAGLALGNHLIEKGARRLEFIARPCSASTVRHRYSGLVGAIIEHGLMDHLALIQFGAPDDLEWVREASKNWRDEPTAVICANDNTAGELLESLRTLGFTVPGDVILGSFDDVRFARLLRPALTSVRQPTAEIGRLAYHAMVTRLAERDLPAREIRVEGTLIERESSSGFGD